MRPSIADLKTKVNLREFITNTYQPLSRTAKVPCPIHEERTPSCHIYEESWHCFGCNEGGDVFDWIKAVERLDSTQAYQRLAELSGSSLSKNKPFRTVTKASKPVSYTNVPELRLQAHYAAVGRLTGVPEALQNRGFDLADCQTLLIAADGPNAVIPITGPDLTILNLKTRFNSPKGDLRYLGLSGHGAPAWCSPNINEAEEILIIEGELNAAACWLARPDLGVMGIAGTSGRVHRSVLKSKTVFVYCDDDMPGRAAKERLVETAWSCGASSVYKVDPWVMDACDIAGKQGRAALRELLL